MSLQDTVTVLPQDLRALAKRIEDWEQGDEMKVAYPNRFNAQIWQWLGEPGPYLDDYLTSMDDAMSLKDEIAPRWFFLNMKEMRTPIVYVGDTHTCLNRCYAEMQWWEGGRLQKGEGTVMAAAMCVVLLRAVASQIEWEMTHE